MSAVFEENASILDSLISTEQAKDIFLRGNDKAEALKWISEDQLGFSLWKRGMVEMVLMNVREEDQRKFVDMLQNGDDVCVPAIPFGKASMPRVSVSHKYIRLDAFLCALFRVFSVFHVIFILD
jgi:hypothetical protein